MNKNMTGTDAIRAVAHKYGFKHSNSFYIQKVRSAYGLAVNQVAVIQSIGAMKTRTKSVPGDVAQAAKKLVSVCHHDKYLVRAALAELTT